MADFDSQGNKSDPKPTFFNPFASAPADGEAWNRTETFSLSPQPPVPPSATINPPAPPPAPVSGSVGGLLSWVVPFLIFTTVLLGVLYAAPLLMAHWRWVEGEAQAEAAYQKRRAELKAETEAAQQFIDVLDQKTNLTSLGFRKVVQLVAPKVVNITGFREPQPGENVVSGKNGGPVYDPDTKRYYIPLGVGSGLIVKPGFVLTNHHVVKKVDRLRVTFASGKWVWVDMDRVASDPPTDLAVIKLPENPSAGLKEDYNQTAVFADSVKEVECGDVVLAVGSPLGLKNTVTHGIISAKGRFLDLLDKMEFKVELLQTDAPINPGNSGGPLFDLLGRVVGINVAIASDTGLSKGIGFAIPSNTAKTLFEELIAKGEVTRGFIGVEMEELPPNVAKELKLEEKGTVRVKGVVPNFPAAKAGLMKGDIILSVDGKALPIGDPLSFFRQRVMELPVGTKITLAIVRLGERNTEAKPIAEGGRPVQHLTLTIEVAAKPKAE